MALREIPIRSGTPHTRQRTTLNGREYVLTLRWSESEGKWYLDLADANGNQLAGSIKLVVNWPLLGSRRGARTEMPPGELFVFDGRAAPSDPGLDELGSTVRLLYQEAA